MSFGPGPAAGLRELRTKTGQGLPAQLRVYCRPGAPLRADGQRVSAAVEESFAPCHLAAAFSSSGRGSVEVHAGLLARLAPWLGEHAPNWSWCGHPDLAAALGEPLADRYTGETAN